MFDLIHNEVSVSNLGFEPSESAVSSSYEPSPINWLFYLDPCFKDSIYSGPKVQAVESGEHSGRNTEKVVIFSSFLFFLINLLSSWVPNLDDFMIRSSWRGTQGKRATEEKSTILSLAQNEEEKTWIACSGFFYLFLFCRRRQKLMTFFIFLSSQVLKGNEGW